MATLRWSTATITTPRSDQREGNGKGKHQFGVSDVLGDFEANQPRFAVGNIGEWVKYHPPDTPLPRFTPPQLSTSKLTLEVEIRDSRETPPGFVHPTCSTTPIHVETPPPSSRSLTGLIPMQFEVFPPTSMPVSTESGPDHLDGQSADDSLSSPSRTESFRWETTPTTSRSPPTSNPTSILVLEHQKCDLRETSPGSRATSRRAYKVRSHFILFYFVHTD